MRRMRITWLKNFRNKTQEGFPRIRLNTVESVVLMTTGGRWNCLDVRANEFERVWDLSWMAEDVETGSLEISPAMVRTLGCFCQGSSHLLAVGYCCSRLVTVYVSPPHAKDPWPRGPVRCHVLASTGLPERFSNTR